MSAIHQVGKTSECLPHTGSGDSTPPSPAGEWTDNSFQHLLPESNSALWGGLEKSWNPRRAAVSTQLLREVAPVATDEQYQSGQGWENARTRDLQRWLGTRAAGIGGDLEERCFLFDFKVNWKLWVEWDYVQTMSTVKHSIYSLLLNQTIKRFISFKNNIICAKDSLAGDFLEQGLKSPLWPQDLEECPVHSEGSAKICSLIGWRKERDASIE